MNDVADSENENGSGLERETAALRGKIRKALSPVLGAKPYVIVIDATSMEQMKNDEDNIYVFTPEYQRGILTDGLLETARHIRAGSWVDTIIA